MTPLEWVVAGFVAGMAAALLLARAGMVPPWLLHAGPPEQAPPSPLAGPGSPDALRVRLDGEDLKPLREDIQGLQVIRDDVQRVGDLLDRLLEETVGARRRPRERHLPPRSGAPGRTGPDVPRGRVREGLREPERRPAAPPPGARSPGLRVRHDERAGGHDPGLMAPVQAFGDPVGPPPAAARRSAPSSDAVYVEAKDDTIVPSERHPPEAWLERRGGEYAVWLNPGVMLTDPALQRWSTFFRWERREPNRRYQVTEPAVVSWSGSAGTLVSAGSARPA